MTIVNTKTKYDATKNPILLLAQNIKCGPPPKGLTPEQGYALHQFFHEVAASAFKLYQIVPPLLADPIIKDKLEIMIGVKPPPHPVPL